MTGGAETNEGNGEWQKKTYLLRLMVKRFGLWLKLPYRPMIMERLIDIDFTAVWSIVEHSPISRRV